MRGVKKTVPTEFFFKQQSYFLDSTPETYFLKFRLEIILSRILFWLFRQHGIYFFLSRLKVHNFIFYLQFYFYKTYLYRKNIITQLKKKKLSMKRRRKKKKWRNKSWWLIGGLRRIRLNNFIFSTLNNYTKNQENFQMKIQRAQFIAWKKSEKIRKKKRKIIYKRLQRASFKVNEIDQLIFASKKISLYTFKLKGKSLITSKYVLISIYNNYKKLNTKQFYKIWKIYRKNPILQNKLIVWKNKIIFWKNKEKLYTTPVTVKDKITHINNTLKRNKMISFPIQMFWKKTKQNLSLKLTLSEQTQRIIDLISKKPQAVALDAPITTSEKMQRALNKLPPVKHKKSNITKNKIIKKRQILNNKKKQQKIFFLKKSLHNKSNKKKNWNKKKQQKILLLKKSLQKTTNKKKHQKTFIRSIKKIKSIKNKRNLHLFPLLVLFFNQFFYFWFNSYIFFSYKALFPILKSVPHHKTQLKKFLWKVKYNIKKPWMFDFSIFTYLMVLFRDSTFIMPFFIMHVCGVWRQRPRVLRFLVLLYHLYFQKKYVQGVRARITGPIDRHGRTRQFEYLLGVIVYNTFNSIVIYDMVHWPALFGKISFKFWIAFVPQMRQKDLNNLMYPK